MKNIVYDNIPDQCKVYICPVCHSNSMEYDIISTKTVESEFRWYCHSCGCEPSYVPHLRVLKQGDEDDN